MAHTVTVELERGCWPPKTLPEIPVETLGLEKDVDAPQPVRSAREREQHANRAGTIRWDEWCIRGLQIGDAL
jgi:hypothetical protein